MARSLIGQILLDQFRVDAFVASGGMGTVYRVWDLKRSAPLAMKVLHAEMAEDPSIFKRFRREARALKKLGHPNIVPFYGLYRTLDFVFLLESYVDGPSLKDLIRDQRGRPIPLQDILTYLKALSAALGYAHAHGVIHCDVKPGNVMIDQGGSVYLTDFGIARHAESTTTTLGFAGSPAYMAPEQIREAPVTPATDVYALGVVLFELLTGKRPFRGDEKGTESAGSTASERIRHAHLTVPPPDPRSLNPEIPESLAGVAVKALSKSPEDRYADVHQMFLAACAAVGVTPESVPGRVQDRSGLEVEATSVQIPGAIPGENVLLAPEIESARPEPKGKSRKRALAWITAGLALTAVLAFAGVNYFRSDITATPVSVVISGSTASPVPVRRSTFTPNPDANTLQSPAGRQTPPTSTRRPAPDTPTRTRTPPKQTGITPKPPAPVFTAEENMFCRDGPDPGYEEHTIINAGQSVPVFARWHANSWLLVSIDDPATRTRCCWIGGDGTLNVAATSIPAIDYLPDRISCEPFAGN